MTLFSIYGEIGEGERIALSKLAVEKYEHTRRPLRIAVDISIWQFQVQSGKGGTNPALRTLYYRLLRLLSLNIDALFIFDGLNKPPFKRNVRTKPHVASLPNLLTKQMLQLFGFPYLTAPGEAEAECALLQREGAVDAVLSEDVDTLMFGCTMSLRNWSSEGTRGNKSPTHVTVYRSKAIEEGKARLDRDGMILIALMSGGDYIPAGIPGCGIKIASEAARAGFGKSLCRLSKKDTIGLSQWRERLQYELRTNESGLFRVKHKALQVPEAFPDMAVLGYYTHPSVSSAEKVQSLKGEVKWNGDVDIKGLRAFVGDAFEWQHLTGAKKFIRGLAPALLVYRLSHRNQTKDTDSPKLDSKLEQESQRIKLICGRRTHFITDGSPEVRVAYIPAEIVNIDLDQEESDVYAGLTIADPDAEDPVLSEENQTQSTSPTKRNPSTYDPFQPEKIWMMETFVKIGTPLTFKLWEQNMKDPKKFASRKARERAILTIRKPEQGALDASVAITKPRIHRARKNPVTILNARKDMPGSPQALIAFRSHAAYAQPYDNEESERTIQQSTQTKEIQTPTRKPKQQNDSSIAINVMRNNSINPWSLSQRPLNSFDMGSDQPTQCSILGSPTAQSKGNPSPVNANTKSSRHIKSSSPALSNGERSFLHSAVNSDHRKGLDIKTQLKERTIVQRCQPSSMKKKNNEIIFIESSPAISPKTPTSSRHSSPAGYSNTSVKCFPLQPSSAQKAHRILNPRTSTALNIPSPTSFSTSLASMQTMLQQLSVKEPADKDVMMTLTYRSHRPVETKRSRRVIALRESLEGAWKEMDEWEIQTKNPRCTYEGVEVLDLTRS